MITVTTIHNPFNELENVIEVLPYEGGTVRDYMPDIVLYEDMTIVAAVNGYVCELDRKVNDEDKIAFSVKVKGTIAYTVAMAAVTAIGAGATASAIIFGVTYVATLMLVGWGVNQLVQALGLFPEPPSKAGPDKESPTYSWGPIQQLETPGNPIPIIFGECRVGGQVISQYTKNDVTDRGFTYGTLPDGPYFPVIVLSHEEGDFKEYLNILLAVNDGEVDSITEVRINEQSVNNFEDVSYKVRLGTLNDEPIDVFSEDNRLSGIVTHANVGVNLNATGDSYIYTTSGNQVEALRIVLSAKRGLYRTNDDGGLDERYVDFKVLIRPVGTTGWYDSGTHRVLGKKTEEIRKTIDISSVDPGQYDIKITRFSSESSSFREQKDITWVSVKEIVKEELIYPGIAKYSIEALATDQLSGRKPSISALVKRNSVPVYNEDTSTWVNANAQNPAWMAYALLNTYHNINKDKIIYDEFKEWADYCDELVDGEPRFRCHVVLDTQDTAWNNIQKVARFGHGKVFKKGSKYGVFVDKPESTVSHLFTMGNIIEETFNMQYLPSKDRANAIEIEYTDPDKDYRRSLVGIYLDDYTNSSSVPKKTNVSFECAITRERVIREAAYLLKSNKYLIRTVEFEAHVDSFSCTIGDLVYFQHMIPHYNESFGGRIVTAGNDDGSGNPYVQLDREVDLTAGTNYAVLIRLSDDTLVEKSLAALLEDQTTDTLILSSAFSTVPSQYDLYDFGQADVYKKTYRITNISRSQTLTRRITLLEYNEAVYDASDVTLGDDITYDPVQQTAVNIEANEFLTYSSGGDLISNVNVSWHPGTTNSATSWLVWIKNISTEQGFDDSFSSDFQSTNPSPGDTTLVTKTDSSQTIIGGQYLTQGSTYRIYVTPIDYKSAQDTGNNTTTIQILGKLAPPSDVENFTTSWSVNNRTVIFRWTEIQDIDVSHYEIRKGASWDSAEVIIKEAKKASAIDYIEEGTNTTNTYLIKAVDTSGIYSINASSSSLDIDTSDCPLEIPENLTLTTASVIANDGTNRVTITASWDANAEIHDAWRNYQVRVTHISSSNRANYVTTETQYVFEVIPNIEYGVEVRAVDMTGNVTNWTVQETITSGKDETPPNTPSSVVVTGFFSCVIIEWAHSAERDLKSFDIYRNTINDSSTATKVGSSPPDNIGTKASYRDEPGDTETYYYWVKSVDTSGNESSFSSVVSASKAFITEVDLGDAEITTAKLANGAVDTDKLANLAVEASKLASSSVESTKIANAAVGSAAIANLAVGTAHIADGSILEAKIGNLAVSSAKIQDAAIQNAKIADLAVDSIKIANNAVVYGKIAADAVTADEIAAGTITSTEIVVSSIDALDLTNAPNEAGADNTASNPQSYSWVSGSKPPVDADVTLENTAADIVNLPATPSGEGLYADGTHLGYHDGVDWLSFIGYDANGGTLFAGTGTGSTDEFIHYNPSSGLAIQVAQSDGITVLSGGGIVVEDGGDIDLKSSSGSTSLITFFGEFYNVSIGMNYENSRLVFTPDTAGSGGIYVGYDSDMNVTRFSNFQVQLDNYGLIRAYSSSTTAYVEVDELTAYSTLYCYYSSTGTCVVRMKPVTREIDLSPTASNGAVTSGYHKRHDFGISDEAWDTIYADDFNNVADFYNMDDYDDLAALHNIKGSGTIEKHTGLEIIDDNTLPEWLISKYKRDKKKLKQLDGTKEVEIQNEYKQGEPICDPDGKPYLSMRACISLAWGAIRQIDNKLEKLIASQ